MKKTILSLISIVGLTLGLNNCDYDKPLKRELLTNLVIKVQLLIALLK
jgi:hypothetical protein